MDFCLIMVCAFIYFNCLGNENKVPYIEVHHVIIYNILTKAYMDFEKESMWCEKNMSFEKNMLCQNMFSSVRSLSHVWLFATPLTEAHQTSLSITNSPSLLKFISIELVMPSNHLIICRPLFLLPSIFPSIRVFSNESVLCIRWPKFWSFNFSISPSNEHSGLIFFRIDWFDLLAVQGTLNSPFQHHSSKTSVLQCINSSKS